MENTVQNKKSALGMVSFILALVGIFFTISILGIPLAILFFFLALIFAIVALVKKEKARPVWTGLIISLLIPIGMLILGLYSIKVLVLPVQDQLIQYGDWLLKDDEMKILITDEEFAEYFENYAENYFKTLFVQLQLDDKTETCGFVSAESGVVCPKKITTFLPAIIQFSVAQMESMTVAARDSWKAIHGITGTLILDPRDIPLDLDLALEEEIFEVVAEPEELLDPGANTEGIENTEEPDNVDLDNLDNTEEVNLTL